jgi:hypothetical protein
MKTMRKQTGKKLIEISKQINSDLFELALIVKSELPAREQKKYGILITKLIYELHEDILIDLYKKFPEFSPDHSNGQ